MTAFPAYALIFAVAAVAALVAGGIVVLFRREPKPGPDAPPTPLVFGDVTPAVASAVPASEPAQKSVEHDLVRAGYFEPAAAANFNAVRAVLTVVPLYVGFMGSLATDLPFAGAFLVLAVVGGVLGYAVPRFILTAVADKRTERIRSGLPMLMDTLGLTLSTGASLPRALATSGESIRRGYPELSHEVRVVLAQAELRSLGDALDRWRLRQPIPELGSLVFLLGQADRLGTDVTRGLWELSASLRVTARQRAEAAANRANFYMAFPTVLCLMIAAGLILAGPGIVQIIKTNDRIDQILDDAQGQEALIEKQVQIPGVTVEMGKAVQPLPPSGQEPR